MKLEALKIVSLDCMYDNVSDPVASEYWQKVIRLKLQGYGVEYPYGVMPIDSTDFVCSHLMLCEERKDGLYPIMAYRSITLDRCNAHYLKFPVLNAMQDSGYKDHAKAIEDIISSCKGQGKTLSYDSAYTIAPEIRKDKAATELAREIIKSYFLLHHLEYGIDEVICGGVIRFQMHRFYHFWGFKDLSLNGVTLPEVKFKHVHGEPTMIYHLKDWSKEAIAHAKTYEHMWKNRICIDAKVPLKQAA